MPKSRRSPEGEAQWKNAIRLWQKDHAPARAAAARDQTRKLRDQVIAMYGGFCAVCGEARREFLTLDHVNSDGANERAAGWDHQRLYRRVRREGQLRGLDPRYRVLCWNCNSSALVAKVIRGGSERTRVVDTVFAMYGGCCACCGEARRERLTLDHVNNDGAAERGRRRSNMSAYRRLRRQGTLFGRDPRYQVLCWNCNCARGYKGYCPHERERETTQA